MMTETDHSVTVVRYNPSQRTSWDSFVRKSKNGVFLFQRDYMEYHSDRFEDYSLMFHAGSGKLLALLPANRVGDILYSHAGLTFGGMVTDYGMSGANMLSIFQSLRSFLRAEGIAKLVYKSIPHMYHKVPADEDLHALYVNGASIIRRDLCSAISLRNFDLTGLSRLRSRGSKKAIKAGLRVERSNDFKGFMEMQAVILKQRYDAKPVHSVSEIEHLSSLFPENIKLFITSSADGKMVSGAIVFEHDRLAHIQYNANSEEGRQIGGGDLLYERLITDTYRDKDYFDFGTSMQGDENGLNLGLVAYKESFGARSVASDVYELKP